MSTRKVVQVGATTAVAVGVGLVSGIVLGGAIGQGSVPSIENQDTSVSTPVEAVDDVADLEPYEYPVNAKGQTYGSVAHATSDENTPDLVLVDFGNDVFGYVLGEELLEMEGVRDLPSSPAEALEHQEERLEKSSERWTALDAYDENGERIADLKWHGFSGRAIFSSPDDVPEG